MQPFAPGQLVELCVPSQLSDQPCYLPCEVQAVADGHVQLAGRELAFLTNVPPPRRVSPRRLRFPACDAAIHCAAARGDTITVRAELKAGVPPGLQGEAMRTPAHYAAAQGRSEALRLLLAAAADPNSRTALRSQAKECYGDGVRLVYAGGQTVLHLAMEGGHSEAVGVLLACPRVDPLLCDPKGPCLTAAARRGHKEAVKLVIQHTNVDSQLALAGHERGRTVLHHLGLINQAAMLELLLSGSTDPASILNGSTDADGWLPLHVAAQYGHTAAVRVLLKYGADPFARVGEGSEAAGDTPIDLCARAGLESAGIKPNAELTVVALLGLNSKDSPPDPKLLRRLKPIGRRAVKVVFAPASSSEESSTSSM